MTPEGRVLRSCMDYLALCGIFHFRCNTQGVPLAGQPGKFRPAPAKGLPDIIGIAAGECDNEGGTPRCGFPIPLPLAVECKSATGRQSPAQREFQKKWEDAGGLYVLCRSAAELRDALYLAGVVVR